MSGFNAEAVGASTAALEPGFGGESSALLECARRAEAVDDAFPEPLTVWLMDGPASAAYERFVEWQGGGPELRLARRDAIIESGEGTPYFLAAMRGEEIVGALPLVLTKGSKCGSRLQLVSAGRMLSHDEEARLGLERVAEELAARRGAELAL